MARSPEGKVKDKITKMLKEFGVWYFYPQAGPFGRAGIPDIIACVGGRFLAIEAKAAGKKPTKLQLACMADIYRAGGTVTVVSDGHSLLGLHNFLTIQKARGNVDASH